MTEITAQSIDEALRKQLDALNTSVESREVGSVVQIGDGIARIDGLKGAMQGELLEFTGEGGKIVFRNIGTVKQGLGGEQEHAVHPFLFLFGQGHGANQPARCTSTPSVRIM